MVAGILTVAYHFDVFASLARPQLLADKLVDLGIWGHLAFVVAFTLIQPFGVPGTIFIVAAPLIWPWEVAFILSLIGSMGASVVGFLVSRVIARDWVAAHIPEWLKRWEDLLERHAFRSVVVLRLIFWMAQGVHMFCGISRIKFSTHFWASLIGYIPPLLLVSYLGGEMYDDAGNMQPLAWALLGILITASVAVGTFAVIYERRHPVSA